MPDLGVEGVDVASLAGEKEIAVVGSCVRWRLDPERGLLLLDVAGVGEYVELGEEVLDLAAGNVCSCSLNGSWTTKGNEFQVWFSQLQTAAVKQ